MVYLVTTGGRQGSPAPWYTGCSAQMHSCAYHLGRAEEDFELLDDYTQEQYKAALDKVKPLDQFIKEHQPNMNETDTYFMKEFILWALVEFKKLSKYRFAEGTQFKDPYGSFISGL